MNWLIFFIVITVVSLLVALVMGVVFHSTNAAPLFLLAAFFSAFIAVAIWANRWQDAYDAANQKMQDACSAVCDPYVVMLCNKKQAVCKLGKTKAVIKKVK